MRSTTFVSCPHCDSPRVATRTLGALPFVENAACGDCTRLYLEEVADTLCAEFTSRLEAGDRAHCSIIEPPVERLPAATIVRKVLRVDALGRGKCRTCESSFDYSVVTLRVEQRDTEAPQPVIGVSQFPVGDIRLDIILQHTVKALSLPRNIRDRDNESEVKFRETLSGIELSFQQPCQHTPRCSSF